MNSFALAAAVKGVGAWTRDTISPAAWSVQFPAHCIAELAEAVRATQGHAGPLHRPTNHGLGLDACKAFAARLR